MKYKTLLEIISHGQAGCIKVGNAKPSANDPFPWISESETRPLHLDVTEEMVTQAVERAKYLIQQYNAQLETTNCERESQMLNGRVQDLSCALKIKEAQNEI